MSTIPFAHDFTASVTSVISSGFDSLANGGMAVSAAIALGGATLATVEVDLAAVGVARSLGGYVDVYFLASVDGTNYTYGGSGTLPPRSARAARLCPPAATFQVSMGKTNLRCPAGGFIKLLVVNNTGQALAASGSFSVLTLHGIKYVV